MRTTLLIAGLLLLVAGGGPAFSQIPDEFTNLKLLDEDIEKPRLIGTMRDWATGLGVRCSHCHVGPDNLVGMDFKSDEKATKRTARRMLEMSRKINRDLLKDLPSVEEGERAQIVSCYTCHRGLSKPPRNLVNVLGMRYEEAGTEAALEQYAEMREEHYAAGRYDFRPATLTNLARMLAEAGKGEDAMKVLGANLELHPDSSDAHAAVGLMHLMSGRLEPAETSLKRALELDPENAMAKMGMQRIDAARAPAEDAGDEDE
jgi:tetratricopeptide (TPR) repeat protein